MLQRPFFFSSRRRHTRCLSDWSSDVCSSDLHLKKVSRQGDKGGAAAYAIENRITEICARFGQTEAMREKRQAPSFPRVLDLQAQGRFALGFYQQKAADAEAIAKANADKPKPDNSKP